LIIETIRLYVLCFAALRLCELLFHAKSQSRKDIYSGTDVRFK